MAWYDRIIGRKPIRKMSALEEMIAHDTNQVIKEARTPGYSAMGTNAQYQESILPPIDQRYLEQLADRYSHLRTVISRIASQSVAKGWEYHAIGDTGDKEERKILESLLRDPTRGDADISGMELFKAMIRQLEIFDDVWVSIVYDRVEGGEMKVVKQLWVEDAKHMRFHVDEFGRFKDDIYFDVNKYSATARLYGQSPIMGLSKKIETALAIENFQNKIYKLERPPKGFLDIPGHDEESLNRLGEYIAEETRRNPNFVPIISSRGEGTGSGQAKFVPVMPNMDELMALPYMERINNDINAAYGVMPIITGSTAGVGGLNAEGEQVSIFDRTILETQKCIEMGFFKPLLKIMGIETWKIKFADINVKNEQQHLANMLQKANIITVLNKVGIEATLDKDGNLKLPDNPTVVAPEGKPEVGAVKP